MINNLTKETNFEIENWSITRTCINSVISFVRVIIILLWINTLFLRTKPKFSYFSGSQQSIILFTEIKNLIKNLLILNCQLVQYPKIQETILPELKKVSSYTRVFTVYGKSVSNRPVYIAIGIIGVYKILTFYFSLRNLRSLQLSCTRVTAFSPASLILERFSRGFRKPVSKTYRPENDLLNLLMTSTFPFPYVNIVFRMRSWQERRSLFSGG